MEGTIEVTYSLICENDIYHEYTIKDLLANERIAKAIKSEFAKGLRNIELVNSDNNKIILRTEKERYTFGVEKKDFADLVDLAEEDAKQNKRLKKECQSIEIIDFVTRN